MEFESDPSFLGMTSKSYYGSNLHECLKSDHFHLNHELQMNLEEKKKQMRNEVKAQITGSSRAPL